MGGRKEVRQKRARVVPDGDRVLDGENDLGIGGVSERKLLGDRGNGWIELMFLLMQLI